jgi:tRNA 2-selenouridine synthase
MFESRLVQAIERLDPARAVLVEAESSKIGALMVPPALWRAMQGAPIIEVSAPRAERARYLVAAYRDILADRQALEAAFDNLPTSPSPRRLGEWRRLLAQGAFETLAEALIELHYDPAYSRSRRKRARAPLAMITLENLDEPAQLQAVEAIERIAGAAPL